MATAPRKTKLPRTAAPRDLKPHEHFRKFLQEGQYRITPERFDVLDAVLAWNDHFDADNLFIYLKNNGSKVSRATVYKTLSLLHECGLVSRYRFSQGHAQYEKTTDRPHHDHMVCTKCGKIVEFENARVERLQDDACAQFGFTPMYHSFQIFGVCLECRTVGTNGRAHAVQPQAVTGSPGSNGVVPLEKIREQRLL
ncbi:MAG: Fur family transcriptional regulator [Candidatus Kapaibacterium sp.]